MVYPSASRNSQVQTHLEKPQEEKLFHKLVIMSLALYDYIEMEYAMSQIFSKKQKENTTLVLSKKKY